MVHEILDSLKGNRRTGQTTLLKKIATINHCVVVVANEKEKKEFGESAITIKDLLKKTPDVPILIESSVIELLRTKALWEHQDRIGAEHRESVLIDKINQISKIIST